jgi:2,3-bisphosphoglycerate-independent phosphoglycerate mutase
MKKPLALIILDGYGIPEEGTSAASAIDAAHSPVMHRLLSTCPNNIIHASGMDVGLPDGQMGNSEVGHTNIGAGRVVYQELTRITKSIADGDFFENTAFLAAIDNCKRRSSALHLIGLLSDGGVHSHNTHLYALLDLAKKQGLSEVYVHCLLDGRDVAPTSGAEYVCALEQKLTELGVGKIATVMGRYYAMDRDNRWERVEKAYDAIVRGKGVAATVGSDAVRASYAEGVNDEFVLPTIVTQGAELSVGDSVIFFNFRPDRAREITRTFVDPAFDGFSREFFPLCYVCLTQYDETMPGVEVAFKPTSLNNTFGEYISSNGLTQLRIAETEKYAHVTFFFNGGVEGEYPGEDRALIPSPKVATYDLKPEMSAYEVAAEAVARVKSGKYDVIVLNFANCDMVGHTGVFAAAQAAVSAVDTCLGTVLDAILEAGGCAIVTADHGNAELMLDREGNVVTAHSTNPVPLVLVGYDATLKPQGRLADIAPTMLDILGLEKPAEMSGESLLGVQRA